jgi:serine/threonine-protein kinase
MAPERFNNQPTTPAADVYSLAGVLCEALTGQAPFPGNSLERAMAARINSPPPRPSAVNPRVPAALDDVVARGMAKEPDDRYGSAGALGRAAQRALQPNGSSATQTRSAHTWQQAPIAQSSWPTTDPTVMASTADVRERLGASVLPIVVGIASALLLGAIGVVIGILVNQKSGSGESPSSTAAHPTEPTSTVAEPTWYQTPSSPSVTIPSTTASAPAAPETPLQRLQQLANSDRPIVKTELANHWVPQLSSKRPGVVDDGVVWDNAKTLQQHLQLRQRYPGVRLLWSGDWSTFSAPNFRVTVVGITFPDSSGALAWCRSRGMDNDHCVAKVVSTTRPIEGSTAYN